MLQCVSECVLQCVFKSPTIYVTHITQSLRRNTVALTLYAYIVLQCAAVYHSVLQCVAVYHSVLQCGVMCCSMLQRVASHKSNRRNKFVMCLTRVDRREILRSMRVGCAFISGGSSWRTQ